MNAEIGVLLVQDAVINGSIYALLALSLILMFTVTRIIFVPQGEFVSYGALTFAAFQSGSLPGSIYVLIGFGIIAAAYELGASLRSSQRPNAASLVLFLLYPVCLWLLVRALDLRSFGFLGQVALTFAVLVPLGPMIYRIVFQPLSDAKVLVLLIAAVSVHLVVVGLGLLAFGPEGSRTTPVSEVSFTVGPMTISAQSLLVVASSICVMLLFGWIFSSTLLGKSLRATAVNRVGARIVGIKPERAGWICSIVAAIVGVASGILISPLTTIYYDSGFIIGLKGFVAAMIGGLTSYTLAAGGALFIGLVESFSSFWYSAYRDVIVFMMLIPVLLIRSLTSHVEEEER